MRFWFTYGVALLLGALACRVAEREEDARDTAVGDESGFTGSGVGGGMAKSAGSGPLHLRSTSRRTASLSRRDRGRNPVLNSGVMG
jgi:hypothetical protein